MFLKHFFFKYTEVFSHLIPPVQNIATGLSFLSLFRYFGKSLKLLTSGLTDFLNVPTSNSKGFLVSIIWVPFFLIKSFHSLGSKWVSKFLSFEFKVKFIGTTSFFTLTLGLLNG